MPEVISFDAFNLDSLLNIERKVSRLKGFTTGVGIGFYDDPFYNENSECLTGQQLKTIYYIVEGL